MSQQKTKRKGAIYVKGEVEEEGILTEESEETENKVSKITSGGLSLGLGEIVKQGTLAKKAGRSWKIRWFVLKYKYLFYFAHRKDATAKGVINLSGAEVKVLPPSTREHSFVVTTSRDYFLAAVSDQEREEWMKAIKTCIPPDSEVEINPDSKKRGVSKMLKTLKRT